MVMWRWEVTQWDDLTGRTLMTCRTSCAGTVVGVGILRLVVGLLVAEWFSTHQRDAILKCRPDSCRSALQLLKKSPTKWEIRMTPAWVLMAKMAILEKTSLLLWMTRTWSSSRLMILTI